jgi:hypothetical protein
MVLYLHFMKKFLHRENMKSKKYEIYIVIFSCFRDSLFILKVYFTNNFDSFHPS